jgi:hypothetical protein
MCSRHVKGLVSACVGLRISMGVCFQIFSKYRADLDMSACISYHQKRVRDAFSKRFTRQKYMFSEHSYRELNMQRRAHSNLWYI